MNLNIGKAYVILAVDTKVATNCNYGNFNYYKNLKIFPIVNNLQKGK